MTKYIGYIVLTAVLCSAALAEGFFAGGGGNYTLFHNRPVFDLYGGYRLSRSFAVETDLQYACPYASNKCYALPFPLNWFLNWFHVYDDTRISWLKCTGSLRIYSDDDRNYFFIVSAGYIHQIRQNPILDGYHTTFEDGFCYGFGFINSIYLTDHLRLYLGSKLELQLYTQGNFNQDASCSANIGIEWSER